MRELMYRTLATPAAVMAASRRMIATMVLRRMKPPHPNASSARIPFVRT
jgi:hypothetical protein